MNPILQRLAANDFADLKGLAITGTIPIKEGLINELITEFLKPKPPSQSSGINFTQFVKKAEIKAETGTVILNFDIGI